MKGIERIGARTVVLALIIAAVAAVLWLTGAL
jgi:hypothetical protein